MIDNSTESLSSERVARLVQFRKELSQELNDILSYWIKNTYDALNGGFIGRIDENNVAYPNAPKGAVLNSRILWSFSAAYALTNDPEHLHLARIAFNYFQAYFIDKEFGGVYWTVDPQGKPLDTKKQVYALAFAIYGCATYYEVSKSEAAKEIAIGLFNTIEEHSFDTVNTGYLEAFTRDWQPLDDLRLSAKDANEKKTMNTHLHVLEAYTSLYRIWPNEKLKGRVDTLLDNFKQHIVDGSGHLRLFFDERWNAKADTVSFGHDIEASWLLFDAAELINQASGLADVKRLSLHIASAAQEGLDSDGGLWYEYENFNQHLIKEKHWWVQAEAMVGFFNAWQLSGDGAYLEKSVDAWEFVKKSLKDQVHGEWFWGITSTGSVMEKQDKVGVWKCPYHNSRACIEIIHRINKMLNQDRLSNISNGVNHQFKLK
ncbi:MAG: AGE family epimerase/isomerase [Bacteroidota bacterium]